jgi:hypothetical protein
MDVNAGVDVSGETYYREYGAVSASQMLASRNKSIQRYNLEER